MRVVHVDLEAITRLLGLNTLSKRERHTHTHTHKTWVVCLFDVEIYCIIKGLVGMLELAIEMLLLVLDKAMEMPKMCVYVHELLPSKIKTKL